MTMLVRSALVDDAEEMASLLNEIIAIGGTTAYEDFFDRGAIIERYVAAPNLVSCVVAIGAGSIDGFQGLFRPVPEDPMPPGWAFIATFARAGRTGGGVGRALFAETLKRAQAAKVAVIDATIRADNDSGLGFYTRMGFKDYDRLRGVPLKDGTPVDRIRKRFDL
jgi:GNAT superfamily N-acetyltransferase